MGRRGGSHIEIGFELHAIGDKSSASSIARKPAASDRECSLLLAAETSLAWATRRKTCTNSARAAYIARAGRGVATLDGGQ